MDKNDKEMEKDLAGRSGSMEKVEEEPAGGKQGAAGGGGAGGKKSGDKEDGEGDDKDDKDGIEPNKHGTEETLNAI